MSADGSFVLSPQTETRLSKWSEARLLLMCGNAIAFLLLFALAIYFDWPKKPAFLISLMTVAWVSTVFGHWAERKIEIHLSGIDPRQVSIDAVDRLLQADGADDIDTLWRDTLNRVFAPRQIDVVVGPVLVAQLTDSRRTLLLPDIHGGALRLQSPQRVLRRFTGRDLTLAQDLWEIFSKVQASLNEFVEGQASERRYLAEQIRSDLEWPLQRIMQEPEAISHSGLFEHARQELADVREALVGEELTLEQLHFLIEAEYRQRFNEIDVSFEGAEIVSTRSIFVDAFKAISIRRIMREAATNIIRHASARRVALNLVLEDTGRALIVDVYDDGIGFDALADGAGHGLRNMRRRASEMGGTVEWRSDVSGGTFISLRVPLSLEEGT